MYECFWIIHKKYQQLNLPGIASSSQRVFRVVSEIKMHCHILIGYMLSLFRRVPFGRLLGERYGLIPFCYKSHCTHLALRNIQISLGCSPFLRSKEKFQRLVFCTLTFSGHLTVRRKTPAPPVASHNTKPASRTYGLSGLKDWCDRQFAAERLVLRTDHFELVGLFFPPVPNSTFGRGLLFFATKKSDKGKNTIKRNFDL